MVMSTNITVTGAAGYVGRHLVDRAIAEGFNVTTIIPGRGESKGHNGGAKTAKTIEADLALDSSIPYISRSEVLVHLAYSRNSFDENTRMACNIIEAARQGYMRRIIHCSTAVVSGFSRGGVIDESSSRYPSTGYQKNKSTIEEMFVAELPAQVELVILRPTVVFGPGGPGLDFIFDRIVHAPFSSYVMYWILKNRRTNLVAIGNVVDAIMLFIRLPQICHREVYLVSDDKDGDNSYGRVDRLIRKCLGKPPVRPDIGLPNWCLRLIFRLLPSHSPPDITYSSNKLEQVGYKHRVGLSDAVRDYVETRCLMLDTRYSTSIEKRESRIRPRSRSCLPTGRRGGSQPQ